MCPLRAPHAGSRPRQPNDPVSVGASLGDGHRWPGEQIPRPDPRRRSRSRACSTASQQWPRVDVAVLCSGRGGRGPQPWIAAAVRATVPCHSRREVPAPPARDMRCPPRCRLTPRSRQRSVQSPCGMRCASRRPAVPPRPAGGVRELAETLLLAAAVNASARPPARHDEDLLRLSFWHWRPARWAAASGRIHQHPDVERRHAGVTNQSTMPVPSLAGDKELISALRTGLETRQGFARPEHPRGTPRGPAYANHGRPAGGRRYRRLRVRLDLRTTSIRSSPTPPARASKGWTTLTALAQATSGYGSARSVTGIHYRHPRCWPTWLRRWTSSPTAASNSASARGWNEESQAPTASRLGSIRERFDRFEEACEVLTSLLSRRRRRFDGKFYQLKDARNEPKGPQKPHPPICIGGSGEKRTLRITAQVRRPLELRRAVRRRSSHASATCSPRTARHIGARSQRRSCCPHVRLSPDHPQLRRKDRFRHAIREAAALGKEGLDLAIVYLPTPHDPRCSNRSPRRSATPRLLTSKDM